MHTLKISIFDSGESFDRAELKRHLLSVIHTLPALRWRILPIPFALHHPVAVDDPEFDIDFHLRHVALPKPGGMREFEEMVGQISSHCLDRRRPLWEIWMVEGLEGSKTAFVMKIHHTLADGLASVQLFTRLMTTAGETSPPAWSPGPLPGRWELVWRSLLSHVRHDARQFPEFVRTWIERSKQRRLYRKNRRVLAVDHLARDIPHCRFNGALTTQRTFATASYSLADFKALKNALDGTLNDVVLALLAGALRRYLLDKGDSVDQPLIAIIPVSADEPGTERLYGNNFSQMGTRLHIRIEDPVARFHKIRESTIAGKSELEIFGKSTMPMLLHYLPPFLFSWKTRRDYDQQLADRDTYAILGNVAISNVPGPRERLVSGGLTLDSLYSVGPLMEGSGLNITVWSYADQLNFSVISCKKLVPDPHNIVLAMAEEFAELQSIRDVSPIRQAGAGEAGSR